ncbi:hypothetical protein GGR50DRAFT_692264 [Xylaria sp. CBS 124048]|nr:hypothetical protein GGR50DRAFT_692264 [Xylaria sp. CBS 124048]
MASRSIYSVAMPATHVSPPVDLASYSRSMHSHTKRQMEAAMVSSSRYTPRSSQQPLVSAMRHGSSSSSTLEVILQTTLRLVAPT